MVLHVVGKSTWVNNIATKDDLIVDIDKIWECISFCDKYNKPNKLQQNAFEVRNNESRKLAECFCSRNLSNENGKTKTSR